MAPLKPMTGFTSTPARQEVDPNGVPAKAPGSKLDAGKAPVWQGLIDYFPRAVLKVAALSDYGANKYSWKGWEKVVDGENRYGNALARHMAKEAIEGPWDLDARNDPNYPAEILHATQQAWNAFARLELILRRMALEDWHGPAAGQLRGDQMDPTPVPIAGTPMDYRG